jgi:hypothetical protein
MQSGAEQANDEDDEHRARAAMDSEDDDGSSRHSTVTGEDCHDRLGVLRRAKRLALNRESARLRRSRKKELLQTLEQKVEALNRDNRTILLANDFLNKRVLSLERELVGARSTISTLMQAHNNNLGPSTPSMVRSMVADSLRDRVDAAASDAGVRRLLEAQALHSTGVASTLQALRGDRSAAHALGLGASSLAAHAGFGGLRHTPQSPDRPSLLSQSLQPAVR